MEEEGTLNMQTISTDALIPVTISEDGSRAVSGRALHAFLEIGTAYKDWMPRMIAYGFEEGKDFGSILSESTGGRPAGDHALTIDMAKELCMIQRTPLGKQAREYFIEVEKQYRSAPALTDEEIVAQALAITSAKVKQLEAKVTEDAPKVEYVEQYVAPDDDVVQFRIAAQQLGVGEVELRKILTAAKWAYRANIGRRWSQSEERMVDVFEWRPYAKHADKFQLRPQHNAPRHHNGQLRQTLYIKAFALPKLADLISYGDDDEHLIDEVQ